MSKDTLVEWEHLYTFLPELYAEYKDQPLMQTKYAFAIALLLNIHDSSFSKCRYYSDDRTINKSKAVYINYNRSEPDKYYAKKCQRKIENTMADG